MTQVLIACRLLLATTFLLAGVAKLLDGTALRQSLGAIGLPSRVAELVGGLLPAIEIGVAIALITQRSAWLASIAAILLLAVFIAFIARSLARTDLPSCGCFGALSGGEGSKIAGFVRNEVLVAVAAFVVWQGRADAGPNAIVWLSSLSASALVGTIVSVTAAALVAEWAPRVPTAVRAGARVARRAVAGGDAVLSSLPAVASRAQPSESGFAASGLPLRTRAPVMHVRADDQTTHTLTEVAADGRPVLLLFTDAACLPCDPFLSRVARWRNDHAHRFAITIAAAEPAHLLAFRVSALPSAVVIDASGRIDSHLAVGPRAIEALVVVLAAAGEAGSEIIAVAS